MSLWLRAGVAQMFPQTNTLACYYANRSPGRTLGALPR